MLVEVQCNLCGENSPRLLFVKEGLNIVRCGRCKLVYVNPRPTDGDIAELYCAQGESDYFKRDASGAGAPGYRDYVADRDLHLKTFEREFDSIEKIKKGGKLLDIGCAAGFSLVVAKQRGWDAYGVEISKSAADYAVRTNGLEIFNGTLPAARYPDRLFDVVMTYGTIEHLTDPKSLLWEMRRILKDDGLAVVATPDIGSWLGSRKFQYKPQEHIYYFSRDTMGRMLRAAGLDALGFRDARVFRSVRYLTGQMKYYFKTLRGVLSLTEKTLDALGMLDVSFFVPDGQMVVHARKAVS